MVDSNVPSTTRSYSRVDAKRSFIVFLIFAVVCAGYWFLLPALQALIIPSAPGGNSGPWVVRPISAFRFGAMAVMGTVTIMLLMRPLQQKWKREDAEMGTRYDPFHGLAAYRGVFFVKGFLLFVIYAAGLVFYLLSWETIGPDGIEQRLPWTTLNYSYQDIASLEMIPDGERSESYRQNGPWYSIKFKNGRAITLSDDNEGSTQEEMRAIATYVAQRSNLTWMRRGDSQPRR